jgi:hypothetical protein
MSQTEVSQLVQLHSNNPTAAQDVLWYETAHQQVAALAGEYGIDVTRCCGIVAALSVQQAWDTANGRYPNLDRARELLATGDAKTFKDPVRKARAILAGADPLDVLSGNKVRSFYRNLAAPGQTDAVTLDRWMARAVGVPQSRLASLKTYERIADAFRAAAAQLHISPDALQASVWTVVRRSPELLPA